jgi:ABC-type antimicrobial peptide transport system permease subunit
MPVPFAYSLRNLWTRRLTTVLTAAGMALVVFVFAATLMLGEGLNRTLVETGSYDNVIITRTSANSEVQSAVERGQAAIVASRPEVAIGADGAPLLVKELVVIINLLRRDSGQPVNVVVRGTSEIALKLRPQVRLVAGRLPQPGSTEVVAGESIARRFRGGGLGETVRFALRDWRVVGIFDAGTTAFNSELWGDAEQLMAAFRRPAYSSLTFRLREAGLFPRLKAELESDPRLTLEVRRETRYYAEQSEAMAKFLRILGLTLTVVFSLGAIIGAMITMYAAVANRTSEIGTLRVLGFTRPEILVAFIAEALLLGGVGGIGGVGGASLLQFLTINTLNWQTFSEFSFGFILTPAIAAQSLTFALVMGLLGGILPALRAARMTIVAALRQE